MKPEQISLKELLQDPLYKEWFKKVPTLRETPATSPPWFLYVRMGRRWSRREYETYPQAFNALVKLLKHGAVDDAAIHAKRQWFKPPVVKIAGKRHYWPMPPNHQWCGYCRRPTRFAYYKHKHHAMPGHVVSPYEARCMVCGLREAATKRYPTSLGSRFA